MFAGRLVIIHFTYKAGPGGTLYILSWNRTRVDMTLKDNTNNAKLLCQVYLFQ